MNAGSPRPYDPEHNPPYQIDHDVELSGKIVASTKRRIKFKFGFSNAKAISSGAIGVGCRGIEHSVELVWSITSGKRLVLLDGRDIHYSVAPTTDSKFQYAWNMPGGVVLEIFAHAAPLSTKTDAALNWRQYDFLVDGKSFFDMPKVYDLGMKPLKGFSSDGERRVPPPPSESFENAEKVENAELVRNVETMDLLGFSQPAVTAATPTPVIKDPRAAIHVQHPRPAPFANAYVPTETQAPAFAFANPPPAPRQQGVSPPPAPSPIAAAPSLPPSAEMATNRPEEQAVGIPPKPGMYPVATSCAARPSVHAISAAAALPVTHPKQEERQPGGVDGSVMRADNNAPPTLHFNQTSASPLTIAELTMTPAPSMEDTPSNAACAPLTAEMPLDVMKKTASLRRSGLRRPTREVMRAPPTQDKQQHDYSQGPPPLPQKTMSFGVGAQQQYSSQQAFPTY